MIIGYARVSVTDQNPAKQLEALLGAGCARIFTDEGIGASIKRRPQLDQALVALERGDTLVVWQLDRLAHSLSHLIHLTADFVRDGVTFRSLSEGIDTSSEQGRAQLDMLGALAQFERSLLVERTRAGLAAAKQRGAKLGRKPKLSPDQISRARQLIDAGESPTHVAKTIGVSTATIYRAIPAGASNRNTPDLFSGVAP